MSKTTSFLKVKDHAVSGEEFELKYNSEFDMLETFPQPNEADLPEYYKSDDYISHTNSKRNLFERIYHFVRNSSLKRKLRLINSFNHEEKTILDIGCGTGDFLEICKNYGWSVYGIEPNEKARAIANKKTQGDVYNTDELLKFKKESFDVITLWHVLEHLPKLHDHIAILKSLLKSNGRLVIAVPNYKSYDAKFYNNFWAAYDVPRHLWHFSRNSVRTLFLKENLALENTLPLKFDAFYVSLLSEKYKSGWMNIFRAFLVGMSSNIKAARSKEYSSLIYILRKG